MRSPRDSAPRAALEPELADAAYRTARRTAVVAGVFSLVVCALLLANYIRGRSFDPVLAPRMTTLKAELARRPSDEALKVRARELDREIRRVYFGGKAFARWGNWMLLAGLVLFVAACKGAKRLKRKLPRPGPGPEDVWVLAARARGTVAVTGVVAVAALAALVIGARRDVAAEYARAVGITGRSARGGGGFSEEEFAKNWPEFRGPGSAGAAPSARPLGRWDGAKGKGIRWKTPVPLPGENSPVVWGDRVFLSGANEKQREVYCFNADDGKLLWRQAVGGSSDAKPASVSEDTGYAASTVVADGQCVYAVFATGHVVCYDFAGQLRWLRNLGVPQNTYGHASSPALCRSRLIIQYDQGSVAEDGKSALLALDAASGQTVWQTKRPVPSSWSTPIVVGSGKERQIVACGNPWVIGYDPETGAERWRVQCLGGDVAPTPVFAGGTAFACNTSAQLAAIRPGGKGDLTKSAIAWSAQEGLPDIASPASNGEVVLLVTTEGMVTCYDAKGGSKLWEHQYDKTFRSSPTIVGSRVYLMDTEGGMHLFEAGRAFKEVGTAALGEKANTCPAFLGDRVYIRGKQNLYCIGGK